MDWILEDIQYIIDHPGATDIVIGIFLGIAVILILWSIAVSTIHIRRW